MSIPRITKAMEYIDDDLVSGAATYKKSKKKAGWIQWGAVAACLCLVVGLFAANLNQKTGNGNHVLIWNSAFSAEQYFKYSEQSGSNADAAGSCIEPPYAETRYFSDNRLLFEKTGVIPAMNQEYDFTAQANFNRDESLYNVQFMWHFDSDIEKYSNLVITAGYEEVPSIDDCIDVEIDADGNVIEPGVTVTEREGIQIIAVGNENSEKTITFKNNNGWYQITGSWNDSYKDVIELLDWFWEHPIDFSYFQIENGDILIGSDLLEHPHAFSEYLPNFAELGFVYEVSSMVLKNGEPVSLEVHYISNVTQEQAVNGEYTIGENGCERVHWCIDANPRENDLKRIVKLEDLNEEQVISLKPVDDVTTETKIEFVQTGCVVTIYTSDVELTWKLIDTIK